MAHSRSIQHGFTLVELMVAVAVLAILMVAAIPSFNDFRQRAALRGASDQVASFWGDARFEALRRNSLVKVGAVTNAAGEMCMGASTTSSGTDDAACNCFVPVSATTCNISVYPSDQSEWRRVRMASTPTIGDTDSDMQGVVVIDPKRANITQPADAGAILLRSPPGGSLDFRLNVAIDRNGRAVICEPSAAPSKLPQYVNRRC